MINVFYLFIIVWGICILIFFLHNSVKNIKHFFICVFDVTWVSALLTIPIFAIIYGINYFITSFLL